MAAIVESSGDAIIARGLDGTLISWNKAAETIFHYTAEEVIGRNVDLIVPEDRTDEITQINFRVEKGEQILPYETLRRRKDGTLIKVSLRAPPIWDSLGGVIGVSVIAREVNSMQTMEQSYARLALAVEHTAESVLIMETDGTILYVNCAFEQVTGYRRDEVLGKDLSQLDSPEQSPEPYQTMWAALTHCKPWKGTLAARRKDGTPYEAALSISPMRNEAKQVIGYVAVQRDVTQENQIEKALRHSQKMEAVGRLAGGIAHDFNNLLTIITGYGQLLLEDLELDDPRRLKVTEINRASARAFRSPANCWPSDAARFWCPKCSI
jgi:PAS domain S-box-containing protein